MTDLLTPAVLGGAPMGATLALMACVEAQAALRKEGRTPGLIVAIEPAARPRKGGGAVTALISMARSVEAAGADFLTLALGADYAHQFEIERSVGIPLVSKVEEVGARARALAGKGARVGLLASQACIEAGAYQADLARRGLSCLTFANDAEGQQDERLRVLAQTLGTEGVTLLITEEAYAVPTGALGPARVLDATEVLAQAMVEYAFGDRPLPAPFSSTQGDPA